MADYRNNNFNDNLINQKCTNYQNEKFEKIKNIEELTHKFITQPKSNEFSILLNESDTCIGLCFCGVLATPAFGLIIYMIISSNYNSEGIYTGIIVSALFSLFALIFVILDLVGSFKRIKITLDIDGMTILKIYKCPCRHSLVILTSEIKRFEINFDEKIKSVININYYDNNNEMKLLVGKAFDEDEAGYLVYTLNKYLQGNPLTPYNNY